MLIILWVILCLVIFIIASCGVFLTRGSNRGKKIKHFETKTPVVVTSTAHTLAGEFPIQIGGYQSSVYVAPYPTQPGVTVQVPMPMPTTMQNTQSGAQGPYMAPYPMSMPIPTSENSPPSYDAVVGAAAGAGQTNYNTTTNMPYEKQSAYNPNFA